MKPQSTKNEHPYNLS